MRRRDGGLVDVRTERAAAGFRRPVSPARRSPAGDRPIATSRGATSAGSGSERGVVCAGQVAWDRLVAKGRARASDRRASARLRVGRAPAEVRLR